MNRLDKFMGGIYFGFLILITCFCLGWWLPYISKAGMNFVFSAGIGLGTGVIVNLLLLKKIVIGMFEMNWMVLGTTYIFYTIGIFGFFMGVPIFNVLLGIAAGYYLGRTTSLSACTPREFTVKLNKIQSFAAAILFAVCSASAYIALKDPYTAANLKGMLGLNFAVTPEMLTGLIIFGGLALLVVQYGLINFTARRSYQL